MTKYFAQDTPQASLERMMMSVPGFQRRGGGISFSSFHYKPEDVDCQYCLHYRRKSCQIPICPYIAERLASGALEYHDLILECLGRNLRLRLYQRIRSVTHWDGPDQAILHKIRPYCQKEANRPQEDIPSVYWAALYLLASRESLWKTAVPALASGYIDFHCISCRGLAVRDYASGLTSFGSQPHDIWSNFPLIEQAHRRLAKVVIENKDFEKLIRQYDRPVSFFYLDPPYHATEGYYQNIGEDGFTEADHIRLRDALMRIQGKFLLSYNDDAFIRGLYDQPSIYLMETTRINNIKQRYDNGAQFPELLIANYDLQERSRVVPSQMTLFDWTGGEAIG